MRSYDAGAGALVRDTGDAGDAESARDAPGAGDDWGTGDGWEVARPVGGTALAGVRMAGFRDRVAAGLDMRVLPQPAVIVVIELGDVPYRVEGATGQQALRSLVAPLAPGPARIRGEHVECVELRLSPRAAYALLGVSPRELGSVTSLEDLWGRHERRLRGQLTVATTWQERLRLTNEFLAQRAARAPGMAPEVAAAWDDIVAHRGRVRVGDLAASCGWSRKRLWSGFSAQIGLTPKRAAMLVRFDCAARALRAGGNAADVAMACGYVDQPHLYRDVLAFAGCTPGALARGATSAG
ncbi:helix-turn-helix domain-containing protein [Streptomyces sp. NPDC018045]|uniref:helix-turn-helix domain-containing protein n=1 Tax=Streptomyces sp. NPDC018045 TaxID=3365037 RepID=UPI0037B82051